MKACPDCLEATTDFEREGLATVIITGYFNSKGDFMINDSNYEKPTYYTEQVKCCECGKSWRLSELVESEEA